MGASSRAETLTRIRGSADAPMVVPRQRGRLPAPIGDHVGGDVDDIAWRAVGGGVRQMKLATSGEGTARLIYIPAGQAAPDHDHKGLDLAMVLSGAHCDESDRFGPGDIETASDDLEHRPAAEAGEPCICIAATNALKFRGLIPRLLGQVVGI